MTDLARVDALRDALEELASHLAAPDLEGLLASESRLRTLLADLQPGLVSIEAADREIATRALTEARQALVRCRHLGASLTSFVRLSFEARGESVGYGRGVPDRLLPTTIDARG